MDVGSVGLSLLKVAESGVQSADKVVNVLGGLCPFWGLEKMAVDSCVEDIKRTNLSMEAKAIAIMGLKGKFRELKNQMAISDIAHKEAKEGTDFSESSKVDGDWLSRFMDAGKHVSDEEVQVLWGNILAAEFETPESAPPSVIRILSEITPKYAKIFSNVCSLSIVLFIAEDIVPNEAVSVVFLPSTTLYSDSLDITLSTLAELELLGLIKFNSISGYARTYPICNPFKAYFKYGTDTIAAEVGPGTPIPTGCVLLTEAGKCISSFVSRAIVPHHLDNVQEFLSKNGVSISGKAPISITELGTGKDREYSFEML